MSDDRLFDSVANALLTARKQRNRGSKHTLAEAKGIPAAPQNAPLRATPPRNNSPRNLPRDGPSLTLAMSLCLSTHATGQQVQGREDPAPPAGDGLAALD